MLCFLYQGSLELCPRGVVGEKYHDTINLLKTSIHYHVLVLKEPSAVHMESSEAMNKRYLKSIYLNIF